MASTTAARLPSAVQSAGYWSALGCLAFSLIYVAAQVAEWVGLWGSAGGPESASEPIGLVILLTPSLFLAPTFLLLMVSIHEWTPVERRVWSHAAALLATAYLVMVGVTYYVQLSWVAPRLAAGRTEGLAPFLFKPFDSFLYSVDILGYSMMCLSMLLAGMVFEPKGREGVTRKLFFANGMLLPFLALQLYWHWMIWVASLWAITFPCAMWSVASVFRQPFSANLAFSDRR